MANPVCVMMAGGTGGHVFPALALAEELRQRNVAIHWLGTRQGIEQRLVPEAQIPLHFLTVGGVRGKGLVTKVKALFAVMAAVWQAVKVLRQLQPALVVGMGGYASGPGGIAAWLLGIPLFIHEQNAAAGSTNKILAKFARKVFVAFAGALPKSIAVGNPVRAAICELPDPAARHLAERGDLHLLVLGGSLGASRLNELLPEVASQLEFPVQIRHQTGSHDEATVRERYQQLKIAAEVSPFVSDMAQAYGWADVVICRAGALTVSEVLAAGVPAVFVPFPYAIDDHQTRNAEYAVNGGAALLKPQSTLTEAGLVQTLTRLNNNRKQLKKMAEQARAMAETEAAKTLARHCMEILNG